MFAKAFVHVTTDRDCLAFLLGHLRPSTLADVQVEAVSGTAAGSAEKVTMADTMTPLHIASAHGWLQDIQFQLATLAGYEALRQMDSLGRTPLYLAVRYNHVAAASVLLRAYEGALASQAVYKDELSLLHVAAGCGHTGMIQQLLDVLTGSEVSAALCRAYTHDETVLPDKSTRALSGTPLYEGVCSGKIEIVKMLLSAPGGPAAIGLPGSFKKTALHKAASRGHAGMLARLLQASPSPAAVINLQDDFGFTALMLAAQEGHTSALKELLKHPECKRDIKTSWKSGRMTALRIAKTNGHHEAAKLLE